jgi:hypothetical protein
MMDELDRFMSQFTDEELAQLFGAGTLDERGALLNQQMMQAEALRKPSGQQHSTGLGAALGGMGDLARTIGGTMDMSRLQKEQEALLGQKDKLRQTYGQRFRQMGQPQMAEDVLPAVPFGM